MNNEQIIKRLEHLTAERKTIDSTWQTIEKYITPYRGQFFEDQTSEHEQNWRKREIFDSTAVNACQTLSASIHGSITSPAFRWFDLQFRVDQLNQTQEAKEWLDDTADRIYNALQESNFNLEIGECYTDLVSYGTSVVLEEFTGDELTGENIELTFSAVPIKEAYFEEDHKGGIATFYRRLMWTPSQIISKFGEENVPEKINALQAKGSTDRMEVVYCIWKRKGIEEVEGIVAPEKRPYAYRYILKEGCCELGEEGGYYEMPAYAPRWRKTSESKWGNSPAMNALNDVLTLNELVELILRSAEKVIDPPWVTTMNNIMSDLDMRPAGLNVVRDPSKLMPLNSAARFDVSQLQKGDLVQAIQKAFYMDQLQLKDSPAMTATETMARMELMQRTLGPTLGRLQSDLLDPLIGRTLNILFRSGQLKELPESLKQNGGDIDVSYVGSLSRSQKMEGIANVERYLGLLGGIAQFKPEVLDLFNQDKAARDLGVDLNIPAAYLNSDEDVQALRQQRAEQQKAQFEAENMKMGGEAMQAVGKGQKELEGE
tara:strand:- start:341 stop:1969 length:1629 start_codon:yes stop_codon:yes gene_type:complete